METFIDYIFKALRASAKNEQQKDLAALVISLNNMDVISKLQKLYRYCVINGEFRHAEEIQLEIIKRQNEIAKEVAENALSNRKKHSPIIGLC